MRPVINGVVEWTSVVVFTVEYCLRVYSMGEERKYSGSKYEKKEDDAISFCGGLLGRLKYAVTFEALIDLAAVVRADTDRATPPRMMRLLMCHRCDSGPVVDARRRSTSTN